MNENLDHIDDISRQLKLYGIVPDNAEEKVLNLYKMALDLKFVSLGDCLTIRDIIEKGELDNHACVIHRLFIILFASLNYGSLCIKLDANSMLNTLYIKCFLGEQAAIEAGNLIQLIQSGVLQSVIAGNNQTDKPLILADGYLYFQKYFIHETNLKKRLHKFLDYDKQPKNVDPLKLAELVKECSAYATYSLNKEQEAGVYLAARKNVLVISGGPGTGKTTLVTSLLRVLYQTGTDLDRVRLIAPTGRAGQRMGESIQDAVRHIVQPEQAMIEQLNGLSGCTIHSLLRFNPSTNAFTFNEFNHYPADVVIVDEVSMIDVALMAALLAALKVGTKIIFLGDKNQLPSVGAGAVLGDLVPQHDTAEFSSEMVAELKQLNPDNNVVVATNANTLTDHVVLLKETHRSKGAILKTADEINCGNISYLEQIPLFSESLKLKQAQLIGKKGPLDQHMTLLDADWLNENRKDQCFILPAEVNKRPILKELLLSWSYCFWVRHALNDHSYQELITGYKFNENEFNSELSAMTIERLNAIFAIMQDNRILSLVREGIVGCRGINWFLANAWREHFDSSSKASNMVFNGAPIMITRNSRGKNLYNGDTGIIIKTDNGHYYGVFKRGEELISLPVHLLPEYELAFAITVHKSQGSEYKNVLIVLPDDIEHTLLTREILYTGITRSKTMVTVVGSKKILQKAVATKINRQSGITLW